MEVEGSAGGVREQPSGERSCTRDVATKDPDRFCHEADAANGLSGAGKEPGETSSNAVGKDTDHAPPRGDRSRASTPSGVHCRPSRFSGTSAARTSLHPGSIRNRTSKIDHSMPAPLPKPKWPNVDARPPREDDGEGSHVPGPPRATSEPKRQVRGHDDHEVRRALPARNPAVSRGSRSSLTDCGPSAARAGARPC